MLFWGITGRHEDDIIEDGWEVDGWEVEAAETNGWDTWNLQMQSFSLLPLFATSKCLMSRDEDADDADDDDDDDDGCSPGNNGHFLMLL